MCDQHFDLKLIWDCHNKCTDTCWQCAVLKRAAVRFSNLTWDPVLFSVCGFGWQNFTFQFHTWGLVHLWKGVQLCENCLRSSVVLEGTLYFKNLMMSSKLSQFGLQLNLNMLLPVLAIWSVKDTEHSLDTVPYLYGKKLPNPSFKLSEILTWRSFKFEQITYYFEII